MSSQDQAIQDWVARASRADVVGWLRRTGRAVESRAKTSTVRAGALGWIQSFLTPSRGVRTLQVTAPTGERPVSEEVVPPPLSPAGEGAVLYRHPLGEGCSPEGVPHRGGRTPPRGPTPNPLGPGSSGEESDSSVQSYGPPSRAKRGLPSRRGTEEEARRRTPAAPACETRSELHWAGEADMAAHHYDQGEESRPMRRRRSHRPDPQPGDRPSSASYWEPEVHRDDYHSGYRGCLPAPRKRRERAEDVHRPPSPPTGYPSGPRSRPVHPAPILSPPAPLPRSLLQQQRDLEEARLEEERRLGEVQERLWRLQLDAVTRPSGPTGAVVPFEVSQGRVSSDSSLLGNQGYLVQPWAEGEDLQEFLGLFDSVYAAWDLPVEAQGQTLCALLTGRPREALLGVPSHRLTDYTTVRDILRAECALTGTLSPEAVSGPSTTAPPGTVCTGKATVDLDEQGSVPHVTTGNVNSNVVLVQSAVSSPAQPPVFETSDFHDACVLTGDPGPNGKGVLESYDNKVSHLDVARFSPNCTVERVCNDVVSQALAESSLVPDPVTELRNCDVVFVQEAGSSSGHRGVTEYACPGSLITGALRGSPRNVKCNDVVEHVPLLGPSACNTGHDVSLCTEELGPQEVSSSQRASATMEYSEPALENVMLSSADPSMAVKQSCSQGEGGVGSEECKGDPVPSTGPCESTSYPSKKVVASALAPKVCCVGPSTVHEVTFSNVGFPTGAKSGLVRDVVPKGLDIYDVFLVGLAANSLSPPVVVTNLKSDVSPFIVSLLKGVGMQGRLMEVMLTMQFLPPRANAPRLEGDQALSQVSGRGLGRGLPSQGEGGTCALGKGGPVGPSQGGVPVFTVGGTTPEWCGGLVGKTAPCELGGPSIRGKVTPPHVLALSPERVFSGFRPKGPLCIQDYASYGEIGTVLSLQSKGGQERLWGTYSRSIIV